jgi:hypothetical protein
MDECCTDYTISVLRRALNEPFYRENTNSGSLGGVNVLMTYK